MITEAAPETLSEHEYAELAKDLAKAVADLATMKRDKKAAMKELDEGIESQQSLLSSLAFRINCGQRELFSDPVSVMTSPRAIDMMNEQLAGLGHVSVVKPEQKPNGA